MQATAAGPEKVPFRQATQAVRAASMRLPGSQGVHADWPEAAETRPSSHSEHEVLPTLPLLAECLPGGHGLHALIPCVGAWNPGRHSEHTERPLVCAKEPWGHCGHVMPTA